MTHAIVDELSRISTETDKCGAEAIGILQCLDENGLIPEVARDMVVTLLQRWTTAMGEWQALRDA